MTRAELYELVWQQPMTHVAKSFGLSDVGLRKICVKHGIPTPPLGYWAKLAYGKVVTRPPLPAASNGMRGEIALVERATIEAPQEVIDALLCAHEFESKPDNKIAVPSKRPHRLTSVAASLHRALQDQHPNRNDFISLGWSFAPTVHVSTSLIDRIVVLIDTLAQAVEQRSSSVQLIKDELILTIDGESFEFRVRETPNKQAHVPTKDELKWKAEREERRRRHPSLYSEHSNELKWDYKSSGRLIIEINDPSLYRRDEGHVIGRWRDRKDQRVEEQLNDVMVSLAGAAAKVKIRQQEELEKLRVEAEAEDRRRTQEARRKRDNKRREFLFKVAREYRQYQALAALHDHLAPKAAVDGAEPLDKMNRVLARLVADMANRFERENLNGEITKQRLIADDDEL